MEDVSGDAPPGCRSKCPPVEVRGRRATRGFFERDEGGEERREGRGGAGDGYGVDDPAETAQAFRSLDTAPWASDTTEHKPKTLNAEFCNLNPRT